MKIFRPFALVAFAFLVSHEQLLAQSPATPAAAIAADTRLPHISVRMLGSGDPVVLIPGLASPREVWSGIVPELARNHQVILVQVNGFGGDEPGANAQEGILPGIVRDLAAYLESHRIERPAVIGHSMGGLVGMMLARDHPGRVGRLMIVDSLPFFGMLMGPGATVETVRPTAERMRDMVRNGPPAADAPPNMSNQEAGRRQVAEWLRGSNKSVVAQALYEDFLTDVRPDLAALSVHPLTVVYAVPNAAMATMAHRLYGEAYRPIEGTRLVAIEDSAHFIMLDQPERFKAAVATFLAEPGVTNPASTRQSR